MQILGRDILISLIVISIIIFINVKCKNERGTYLYNICIIIFSMTMVIIFSLTGISPMSGFHIDIKIEEISFIPFMTIIEMLQGGITLHTIINIIGNIVMFMPVGFFSPLLWTKLNSLKKVVLFGFGISFIIEFTQLFLIRATDINDLILNTSGTMLGYLVLLAFKKLIPEVDNKINIDLKFMKKEQILFICILVPYIVIIIGGFYDRYINLV